MGRSTLDGTPASSQAISLEVKTRKEFEAWISSSPYELSTVRFPETDEAAWPGQYMHIDVELAWNAWKTALDTNGET